MERPGFPFENCTWLELTETPSKPKSKAITHVIWILSGQNSLFCLDFMRKNIAIHSWIILADDEPESSPTSASSQSTGGSSVVVVDQYTADSPNAVIRLGYGMFDGFTGIVLDPLKGVREDGVKGFFKVINLFVAVNFFKRTKTDQKCDFLKRSPQEISWNVWV